MILTDHDMRNWAWRCSTVGFVDCTARGDAFFPSMKVSRSSLLCVEMADLLAQSSLHIHKGGIFNTSNFWKYAFIYE